MPSVSSGSRHEPVERNFRPHLFRRILTDTFPFTSEIAERYTVPAMIAAPEAGSNIRSMMASIRGNALNSLAIAASVSASVWSKNATPLSLLCPRSHG